MFAVLALASAVCYGAADFLGGFTAKRANTLAIVVVSQLSGLGLLLVMLPVLPASAPLRSDFVWGAVAGLTGGSGVALLYRALAIGVMAVVAPTTAVCAVAVPVLAAVAFGERPGLATIGGIALAIVAIVLVSQSSAPEPVRDAPAPHTGASAFLLALIAGVVIGFFFLALARASDEAGLWPLVAARIVAVSLFAAIAALTSQSLRVPMGILGIVASGGILDMLANLLYLIATRSGPLSVVVTLASLYPASTVLLARIVLHERLNTWQWTGVVCALVAVIMIVR
jgi:drug/metabolite transporter (DMT)-like permease